MNFEIINEFFDHVYVLTLRRATDRHKQFEQTLKGLNYEVFYGKDKNDFDVEELKKAGIYDEELAIKHERHSHAPSPGAIGCSWSHRLIYEDIIENNFQRVLILEDDIVINQTAFNLLPDIFKELPNDWDLLYYGFSKNETRSQISFIKQTFYHVLKLFNLIKYSHTTIRNIYPKKVSKFIYTSGFHDCTHAYAITLEGAKKLVELQTPLSYYADNLLAYAATNKIINAYIILPKIIYQEFQLGIANYSYIQNP